MNRVKDLEALESATPTVPVYVAWTEGGGGEVVLVDGRYVLYEVPQYGGQPQYTGTYDTPEEVIDVAYSWT